MRLRKLVLILLLASIALSGCRFAVVETGSVRVEAPTPTPRVPDDGQA